MASDPRESPKARRRKKRQIPKEENIEAIKNVLKNIGDEDITVDQFVGLVSQHTGDRGFALTQAMTEDLNCFRKMVMKVYETMTQDVSDVLANEQMELAKMYEERHRFIIGTIMHNCQELKDIYPEFNFEEYYADPEQYIKKAFVIPELPEEEEIDTVKRHLAFHRLQWLQSEGGRLKAENSKLQKRLADMKKEQRDHLKTAVKLEVEAEQTHLELTEAERSLQAKLDELNQTIQDVIIQEEKNSTRKKLMSPKTRKGGRTRSPGVGGQRDSSEQDWSVAAAKEIETIQLSDRVEGIVSRLSLSASSQPSQRMRVSASVTKLHAMQTLADELNQCLEGNNANGERRPTPRSRPKSSPDWDDSYY